MKENQHTELKQSWRDEYLRWICGFANAEGGTLVIGRDDKGKAVGAKDARKLMEDIPNKVRDILGIMVDVNLRELAAGDVLEIVVPAYSNPISYKGEYFYRSGSTNQTLKGAALDRFLLRKQGLHWDGVPDPQFKISDGRASAFRLFAQKAAQSGRMDRSVLRDKRETILGNLDLVKGHYLKRAASLLFSDKPDRYVGGAWIKVGFFVTNDDLRYQDEIHGCLIEQVDKTLELLSVKYLKGYISYEGLQRRETFLFPMDGLREVLLNAVVHKDYGSGIPIQISVYDDRIVFWNPGRLPENWTLARLLGKHPSAPYNPLLANAFFRAGYIESWGRGVEKIERECREHDIEPPEFDDAMSGLMVTFRANPEHLKRYKIETPVKTRVKTPVEMSVKGSVKAGGSVSGPESRPESRPELRPESRPELRPESRLESRLESALAARIVLIAATQAMGKAALARNLGHKTVSGELKKQVQRLLEMGVIAMTLPDKPNSRLQKYGLTSKGEALVAEQRKAES